MKKFVFALMIIYASTALADLAQDKEKGKDIAKSLQGTVTGSISNIDTHKDALGYEGTNVRGNGMSIEEAESSSSSIITKSEEQAARELAGEEVQYKCDKENCEVGHTFSSSASASRQENLDKLGFGKDEDGMPLNNTGYLDKAMSASREFSHLTGDSSSCSPTEEVLTSIQEETCDKYYDTKISSCLPKQVVEIDPKYKYSCTKKREEKYKICHDEITSITCKKTGQCDMGGIKAGTIDSDIGFQFENGELSIGKQHYVAWGNGYDYCAVYDRSTSFELKNVDKIKEFTLIHVRFDDYIQVDINGTTIYAGPHAGATKADVVSHFFSKRLDDGTGIIRSCELSTDWNRYPNINLIPYLREGQNTIRFKVVTTGTGTGSLKIKARQVCCSDWDIKREEICSYS